MKHPLPTLVIFLLVMSCKRDGHIPSLPVKVPAQAGTVRPDYFESQDASKTFFYNHSGQLIQIMMQSRLPNGSLMNSRQDFVYNAHGQLRESTTDTGWRMVYTLVNDRITRTDEYITGTLSRFHTYSYDTAGRLSESITWQDHPAEGGVIPIEKDTYTYDTRGNISTHQLYFYSPFAIGEQLLNSFTYSDYDNKLNSEDHFDKLPFNPLVTFNQNNPGKMVVHDRNGRIANTETYTYQYDEKGYASIKNTVSVSNGNPLSYRSIYRFRD